MLGNKLRELRARRAAGETGFTLVELLVVVVIIVALAAIAVPIFLNQSQKADNAASEGTLASAAKFVSAGIAAGDLLPAAGASVPAGGQNFTSEAGSFFVPAGYNGSWALADGEFCFDNGQTGDAARYISQVSGGVQDGSCA